MIAIAFVLLLLPGGAQGADGKEDARDNDGVACEGFTGVKKTHYPDGRVKLEMSFECGLLHGSKKYFTKDGALSSLSHYQRGLQHGQTVIYDVQGRPQMEMNYDNGLKHGSFKTYHYEDETVVSEQQFKKGAKDGTTTVRIEDGELYFQELWERGRKLDESLETNLNQRKDILDPIRESD